MMRALMLRLVPESLSRVRVPDTHLRQSTLKGAGLLCCSLWHTTSEIDMTAAEVIASRGGGGGGAGGEMRPSFVAGLGS